MPRTVMKRIAFVSLSAFLYAALFPAGLIQSVDQLANISTSISSPSDVMQASWNGTAWRLDAAANNPKVGYFAGGQQRSGVRLLFRNVAIPQGARVISASFSYAAGASDWLGEVNSVIMAEATDNASALGTVKEYASRRGRVVGGETDRNLTTARLVYKNVGAQSAGNVYNSPDLSPLVQEVISRPGWRQGNSLAIFWDDHEGLSADIPYTSRQVATGGPPNSTPVRLALTYDFGTPIAYSPTLPAPPYAPTNLKVSASGATSAVISWKKGAGSTRTLVRYRAGGYPSGQNDGGRAYFDTGDTAMLTGLLPDTKYYVRVWSYTSDGAWSFYSHSYADVAVATRPYSTSPSDFTMVFLPDTQSAVAYYPSTYQAMMKWVADNAAAENVTAVVGLGDVVDNALDSEFVEARAGWDRIKNTRLVYVPVIGNHDYSAGWNTSLWNTYFGQSYFSGKGWYSGSYQNDTANYYVRFGVSGQKFMVLALEFFPRAEVLAWAQGIINANPDRKVILITHAYLGTGAKPLRHYDNWSTAHYGFDASRSADSLWRNFIRKNPSIFLVAGGHVLDRPFRSTRVDTSESGSVVNSLWTDYQSYLNGDNGYVVLLRFQTANKEIAVQLYDTRSGSYVGTGYTFSWQS